MSRIAEEIRIKDMIESLEYKRNHSQIARDALEVIKHLTKERDRLHKDAVYMARKNERLMRYIVSLRSELAEKDKVLMDLDAYFDFSAPLEPGDAGIVFDDVSGINEVFKRAYALINPDQAAINGAIAKEDETK